MKINKHLKFHHLDMQITRHFLRKNSGELRLFEKSHEKLHVIATVLLFSAVWTSNFVVQ